MRLLLISVIFLAGCATKEMSAHDKAWNEQCLPYTGCPLNLETPEQFAARKMIEEKCAANDGCGNEPDDSAEVAARKEKWNRENRESIARKAKNDQIAKECKWEVAKAMGSGTYAYNAYMAGVNAMADTFREVRLMRQCLEAKGYIE